MKDLGALQRMAKEMQAKMERAQAELAEAVVEGSAGGGVVKVTMTGAQDIKSITIGKDAVDPADVETLQDLVLAAVRDAIERSKKLAADKLGAATGGLRLPGM